MLMDIGHPEPRRSVIGGPFTTVPPFLCSWSAKPATQS